MFECRCLLLLLLLSLWRVNADIRGRLLIRVACYDHPSNLRSTGRSCDVDSDCDPKFRFCLSSRPQSAHNCELERLDPFSFENTQKLGECVSKSTSTNNFPAVISVPVSADTDQLFLTVDLDDVDRSHFATRSSEIDRFRFDLFPGLPSVPNDEAPSRSSYAPLNISARDFHGAQQPRLQLLGVLVCAPSRFGPRCTSFCQPTPRYTCTANGSRTCRPGWHGDNCQLQDACLSRPCKSWAECRPVDTSFECLCDGRSGPQCVAGSDPCLNHRCANNATCIGVDSHPECECKPGWMGKYCEERDPCWPDKCKPNGRCFRLESNISDSGMKCQCDEGYSGPYCKVRLSTMSWSTEATMQSTVNMKNGVGNENSMVTTNKPENLDESTPVIYIFAALSGFVVVGLVLICVLCYLRQRRGRERDSTDRSSQVPMLYGQEKRPPQIYEEQTSVYDEPGRIYSVIGYAQKDFELNSRFDDVVVNSDRKGGMKPPLPERQNSTVSNGSGSRRCVRFVRVDA